MRTHRRLLRYLLHVYLNMEPFWSLLKYAFRMVGGGGGGGGNLEDLLPSWQQEFFYLFILSLKQPTAGPQWRWSSPQVGSQSLTKSFSCPLQCIPTWACWVHEYLVGFCAVETTAFCLTFHGECDSGTEHETFSILTKRECLMHSECWHWSVEFFSMNIICCILARGSLIIEFLHQIGLLRKNVPELDRANQNQPIEPPMRCVRTFSKRCCSWASSCCRHPSTPPQTETRWHLLVACSHWELAIKKCRLIQKKLSSLQSAISIQCTLPFP